jgi:hypothetical protein
MREVPAREGAVERGEGWRKQGGMGKGNAFGRGSRVWRGGSGESGGE